ncbi:MAG: hypothetical protein LBK23_00465 [Oscillospiraceae bacterium]|jgi:hypothetical protein|nr:hypothetical protein [Oscillospiraceae bacterium]
MSAFIEMILKSLTSAAPLLAASALLLAAAAFWIKLRRTLFTPVSLPRGAELKTVLTVSGDGDGLERSVGSLLWLCETAGLEGGIIIEDRGLTGDGARIARLLEADNADVTVMGSDTYWTAKR